MRKFLHFGLAVIALALTSCSSMKKPVIATPEKPDIKNLSAHSFSQTIRTDYLLFTPQGYDSATKKRWPLIIFLHGSGERGTNAWRTSIWGPTKFIEKHPDFPFLFVSPQVPEGSKWSDDAVMGLIDEIIRKYKVDTNRIYLTGLSMGGYGTWSLATTYPERFAAVAPVCGGEGNIGIVLSTHDKSKIGALKNLPIWAFHGDKDNVVAWGESDRMVKAMKALGNQNVKFTTYPGIMHNSWSATYDNPELYDWFLEHRLEAAKKAAK